MSLHDKMGDYSQGSYPIEHMADSVCVACAGRIFSVLFDETQGISLRLCKDCGDEHWMGDSAEYIDEVEELDPAVCTCGHESFQVTVGVALYQGSKDVKWVYLGCACEACGLGGVYADWKNEFPDYNTYLQRV